MRPSKAKLEFARRKVVRQLRSKGWNVSWFSQKGLTAMGAMLVKDRKTWKELRKPLKPILTRS